jgi:hypothetical protein
VRDIVLGDPAPFLPLTVTRRRYEIDYGAKPVTLGRQRYIVCRNEEEAKKNAAERIAILESLARQLKRGDKALVGNTGYRRFLKTEGTGRFASIRPRSRRMPASTGFLCCTPMPTSAPWSSQTMLRYKQLWTVEAAFSTAKHLFATAPSITSSTRRSAATSSARSSRCC